MIELLSRRTRRIAAIGYDFLCVFRVQLFVVAMFCSLVENDDIS